MKFFSYLLLIVFLSSTGIWQGAKAFEAPFENSATVLTNGPDAFGARIDLINSAVAGDEILASYYQVGNDSYALAFLEALFRASERGVKVKLLTDNLATKLHKAAWAMVELFPNFEYRTFKQFPTMNPLKIFRRIHDKMLLLKGKRVIFGGRNMMAKYFEESYKGVEGQRWFDLDVIMTGEILNQIADYFENELWVTKKARKASAGKWQYGSAKMKSIFLSCLGQATPGKCVVESEKEIKADFRRNCSSSKKFKARDCNSKASRFFKAHKSIWQIFTEVKKENALFQQGESERIADYKERSVPYDVAMWFDNHSNVHDWDKGVPENSLTDILYRHMENAEERLWLMSPYFVTTKTMREAIGEAREKQGEKLDIQFYTNSMMSSDVKIAALGSKIRQSSYEHLGVEVYRQVAENPIHAKLALIDERISFVSSHNYDQRSESLNSEAGAVIYGVEFAQEIEAFFATVKGESWLDDPEGKNRKARRKLMRQHWGNVFKRLVTRFALLIPRMEYNL